MSPGIFTSSRLIAFLLLAGNWYVSHHGYISTLSTPLWSISVEEQFYVVWPSIRKYFGRRTSIAFSIVMLVVSFLALGIAIDTWTNSFVQFQFFSTGALLALALRGRIPHISPAIRLLLFAAGMLALLNCTQYFPHVTRGFSSSSFPWSALIYLSINVGCILLFLSFLGEPRLGASRLLVYLGRISYGLYVFHWICLRVAVRALRHFTHGYLPKPLTNLFEILLALCLTIACAAASYRFFEAPILRYKNRFEFVRTRV
jgi:peptidoglycan/LPS O-acetylase OafA/YrhL